MHIVCLIVLKLQGKWGYSRDDFESRFGSLIVISIRKSGWKCKCVCGAECLIIGHYLTRKHDPVQSCGCLRNQKVKLKRRRNRLILKMYFEDASHRETAGDIATVC